MRQKLVILSALMCTILAFQNCLGTGGLGSPEHKATSSSRGSVILNGDGQPYDGKPFVIESNCDDGTFVSARILMQKDGSGLLYRNQCRTDLPTSIPAIDIQRSNGSDLAIEYQGQVYHLEESPFPMPGMVDWHYQLQGDLSMNDPVGTIYIISLFEYDSLVVNALHNQGYKVVCSVSAGTAENWNPDYNLFNQNVLGNPISGSSGERWVDIRSSNVKEIMIKRLDLAKDIGCDGVDFDAVGGFVNNTGFAITREDQLAYNLFLAFAAHDRKMNMVLNNVPELAEDLSIVFDLAIAENCFRYSECDSYQPFIDKNKPVLVAEYVKYSQELCDEAKSKKLSLTFFNYQLDGSRIERCE